MARSSGLMGPWEWWRRAAFVVAAGGGTIFLAVLLSFPLGIAVLIGFIVGSQIWKEPGVVTNNRLGTYMVNTYPHRIASFLSVYKRSRRQILSPVVAVGFGPPTEDPDHQLHAGWWPMTRLSAYWSLLVAAGLGSLDLWLDVIRLPFWGVHLPPWLLAIFSTIGWFALIQSILAVRRITADGEGMGGETAPATMFSRVPVRANLGRLMAVSLAIGALPALVLLVLWITLDLRAMVAIPLILCALLASAVITVSRMLMTAYREPWMRRIELRAEWNANLAFLKNAVPYYVTQTSLPSKEEWDANNPDAEENGIPYVPFVHVATFGYPPNCTLSDYVGRSFEDRMKGALNATSLAIAPIGLLDPQTQTELPGTVGTQGMRIWWTEERIEHSHLIRPDTDDWLRELAVRSLVMDKISRTRGLGVCTLLSCNMMTRQDSAAHILEVRVIPPHDINLNNFLGALRALSESLGNMWIRAYQPPKATNSVISLLLGDDPDEHPDGIRFHNPASLERIKINVANWSYYFYATGVVGHGGTPTLRKSIAQGDGGNVRNLLFNLPPGMSFSSIEAKMGQLGTTSGNAFLEITRGNSAGKPKSGMNAVSKVRSDGQETAQFTVTAAREDPLAKGFPFTQYRDQLILGRQSNTPQINWFAGVLGDGNLARYDWDDEQPHLLIAGASGSGKSNITNSMLCQLVANNGPETLRLRMVEPKNELQVFSGLDVVEKFVDSWYPDDDFFGNVADMLEDTVAEMNRRNKLMASHPRSPKKLSTARQIALKEGPMPDGSSHPLLLPFIFVVIEECATVFAESASKEERQQQARIVYAAAELARKARSSGIYLICATQYPTNASIPSVIRQQMRRIGLRSQDALASRVIIGQNGLEEIRIKGAGKISAEYGGYRNFRGFFMQDGDPDTGGANDVNDVVDALPSNDWMVDPASSGAFQTTWSAPGSTLTVPEVSTSLFSRWQSKLGAALDRAIQSGASTRDIKTVDDGRSDVFPTRVPKGNQTT